jgi:hypothetical protein
MKRYLPLVAAALGWLASGPPARADETPAPNAQWTYNFSPVNAPGAPPGNNPQSVLATDGKSGVSLTNQSTQGAVGPSDVVATSISAFSASPTSVGFGTGGNYAVQLVLTDSASGKQATYVFQGQFGGNLSAGNSKITSTILGGSVTTSQGTLSFNGSDAPEVSLGNFNYTVNLDSYTHPGPPSENLPGSLGGTVNVTTLTTSVSSSPEPSALLLSAVGLSFVGVATWRKRRSLAAHLA